MNEKLKWSIFLSFHLILIQQYVNYYLHRCTVHFVESFNQHTN